MHGMPSSSSRPSMNSASLWCWARATFTSCPCAYWGLILRARRRRALAFSSPPEGCTRGMPHEAQKRSLPGYVRSHCGHTSSSAPAAPGRASRAAITPQHSFGASSRAWAISSSSSAREMSTSSPPDGRVKVLDLVHRQRVDAAGEVLPAVVGHDEHDVALIQLARDAHGDARDGTARDAREEALFVQQP